MKTIYKYPLTLVDEQTIQLPKGADILSVQWIRNQLCIYALVDTQESEMENRQIKIFGTGNPILPNTTPKKHLFVGTIFNQSQTLVFHVFAEVLE